MLRHLWPNPDLGTGQKMLNGDLPSTISMRIPLRLDWANNFLPMRSAPASISSRKETESRDMTDLIAFEKDPFSGLPQEPGVTNKYRQCLSSILLLACT